MPITVSGVLHSVSHFILTVAVLVTAIPSSGFTHANYIRISGVRSRHWYFKRVLQAILTCRQSFKSLPYTRLPLGKHVSENFRDYQYKCQFEDERELGVRPLAVVIGKNKFCGIIYNSHAIKASEASIDR